jgi:integrase
MQHLLDQRCCDDRLNPPLEEALQMTWAELDLSAKKWTVHKSRMKAGKTQEVSLPAQAVDLLRALRSYNDGEPRPMGLSLQHSEAASSTATGCSTCCAASGTPVEQVTTHGMRKSLRSYLGEVLKVREEVAEAVIAHDTRSRIRKTYERTRFYDERIELMNEVGQLH